MRHIQSYSIAELASERDSVIKGEDLQLHMSLEYYHKRITAFHSRIVKVKMSSMTLDMKDEICTRLIKKILLKEQNIALIKKQYGDIDKKVTESYKDVTTFYKFAIDTMLLLSTSLLLILIMSAHIWRLSK